VDGFSHASATAYWHVTVTMALSKRPKQSLQMLLPLSDGRQAWLARRASATGVSYREEADGLNLWGHWVVRAEEPDARRSSPTNIRYRLLTLDCAAASLFSTKTAYR